MEKKKHPKRLKKIMIIKHRFINCIPLIGDFYNKGDYKCVLAVESDRKLVRKGHIWNICSVFPWTYNCSKKKIYF